MIRALFRLLSMIALAVAVIMAVLDATRSIAAETLVLTPLASSWASVSPSTLESLRQSMTQSLPPILWDPIMKTLLAQPGFVIFAALALLLAMIGRRPAAPSRFAYGR
jgi:hypothetical protein